MAMTATALCRRAGRIDETSRHDADGGDSVRECARHAVRHPAAIGKTCDVDALLIDWKLRRNAPNERHDERHVADMLRLRGAATCAGIPVRPRPTESPLAPVRIGDEEAARVGDRIETRRAAHRLGVAAAAMQRDDERPAA